MSRSWQGPLLVEPCQPAPNISAESGMDGGQKFGPKMACQNLNHGEFQTIIRLKIREEAEVSLLVFFQSV